MPKRAATPPKINEWKPSVHVISASPAALEGAIAAFLATKTAVIIHAVSQSAAPADGVITAIIIHSSS